MKGAVNFKKAKRGTLPRVLRMLWGFYPVLLPLTALCILFSAAVSAVPSLFIQQIIDEALCVGSNHQCFNSAALACGVKR